MERRATPSFIHNWVSLAGIVLAASSFFAVALLIAIDFMRGFRNPYLGILTYIVAPAFLIGGLLLIAIGAWRERRRRRRLRPGEIPAYPRLDLNSPHDRKTLILVVVLTAVFLLSTAVGSYRTYHFTESVAFCGKTCHKIMSPEYTAYQESPHARVICVQCHIGSGASWFVKSKLSGSYQVYAALANKYPRPIPTPIQNLRPARETCEACHWPREFFGAVESRFDHYLPDEQNTLWTIQMLLKVGGGDPGFGDVGGIHWHMAIANKIEYIASDKQRQTMPWVRMTDQKGHVTVFESTDHPLTAEQIAAATPRVMDCIDCHNRPTHIYHTPVESVNLALQTGRIPRAIPHIKEQAVHVLLGKYSTTPEAESSISDTLKNYYRKQLPAFADSSGALIAAAIRETQAIYTHNFFPVMKVDWRAHPDNVGHKNSPGCFRCHDGSHTSADGKAITHQCNACHTIIVQGATGQEESSVDGLEFKHPVDIDEAWKEMNCFDCHDGSMTG
jgi:hypothetical protein